MTTYKDLIDARIYDEADIEEILKFLGITPHICQDRDM